MLPILLLLFFLIPNLIFAASITNISHLFKGFKIGDLQLDGGAVIENGTLMLCNGKKQVASHAFFPTAVRFRDSMNSSVYSFSINFVFSMGDKFRGHRGEGMAFVIAPSMELPRSSERGYLGLFNESTDGIPSNHIFAVEFDVKQNRRFNDSDDNHVGININSIVSNVAKHAESSSRYMDWTDFDLSSSPYYANRLFASIEYDGVSHTTRVILDGLYNLEYSKIKTPLIKYNYDLSTVMNEQMYLGFSTSTEKAYTYVLGSSFQINGTAPELDSFELPHLSNEMTFDEGIYYFKIVVSVPVTLFMLGATAIIAYIVTLKLKFSELVEDWEKELNYISRRFKYKDLYIATKGFKETEVIGIGGFGKVYKGKMPRSNLEIALKRISHDSSQGMREFVEEVITLGRFRHRNLVPLLGYCRRKGELFMVYEYMPNGNLNKLRRSESSFNLKWSQRSKIIEGMAYGLLCLHEQPEQIVIHRNIKPGNILLDGELNPRLGDFGFARLYDHDSYLSTTNAVRTLGYIAPECSKMGEVTKSIDVFAFGVLVLEIVSGRRPLNPNASSRDEAVLVDWVHSLWTKGEMVSAIDRNLGRDFSKHELEFVLKLGLLCTHSQPDTRPSIRDIVGYLDDPSTLSEVQCADALNSWVSQV